MIKDLKELEKFFKICRKQGVAEITVEGIAVKFGDLPPKVSQTSDDEEIESDGLTPDELIYYAVEGQV